MHLLQFLPVITTLASLWIIVSDLIRSMSRYEALNASLQQTVEERTAELEKSYARISEIERSKAIDAERQRIMFDLHDGVGGQLVNTLAYMRNTHIKDKVLQGALEDALRDLALMLDTMEVQDSIATLMGMLRERLDGLLAEHGIRFIWQIHEEPVFPDATSTQNLNLLRIVQEAITNVIKHAKASTVTVSTTTNSITIEDNGDGFVIGATAHTSRPGYGVTGMQRRAELLGANLLINPTEKGTTVKVHWP